MTNQLPNLPMTDSVYLFRISQRYTTDKICKIGVSSDVKKRRKAIQSANADEVFVDCVCKSGNAYDLESVLHSKYKQFRERGEWFRFPQEFYFREVLPQFTELEKSPDERGPVLDPMGKVPSSQLYTKYSINKSSFYLRKKFFPFEMGEYGFSGGAKYYTQWEVDLLDQLDRHIKTGNVLEDLEFVGGTVRVKQ